MVNPSRVFALLGIAAVLSVATIASAGGTVETDASPTALHFPENKQNESPMAVNPVNANNAISGANDEINEPDCTLTPGGFSFCPFVPGVDTAGVYFTVNGGASWQQTILDWCPGDDSKSPTCKLVSDGDPVVSFGPKPDGHGGFTFADGARAYFGSLASAPSAPASQELLAVSSSDDGGASWSGPHLATNRNNPVDFNDKISVWADANPSSPFFGNVYVAWTLFVGNPNGNFGKAPVFSPSAIMLSVSHDGGQTFSAPQKLSPSFNNGAAGGRQGSEIRSGPDGKLYVFWDGSLFQRSAVMAARSTDGGASFTRPFLVSFKNDNPSPFPGASFRTNSFPQAGVSQADGKLFVTWADYDHTSNHGVVKLATSIDTGNTWSVSTVADVSGRSPFYPAVAVSPNGGKVLVGFNAIDDKPDGTEPGAGVVHYDAYYVKSSDAGASFSSPLKVSAISSDPDAASTNGLSAQFLGDYNGADASDSAAFFSWTDTRNGAPCAAVDSWRASGFTATRPNIYASCPADFGNSDIFVVHVPW
jgi:hypothetical protein